MTIWCISDTHFRHANILTFRLSDGSLMRPFASVEEMDELMVQRWNERVRPSDHIYHLGDLTMDRQPLRTCADLVRRLNGHKRLVLGNHDQGMIREYLGLGFEKIFGSRVLDNMIFTHIPIHPLSLGRFDANIHGHIHSNGGGRMPAVVKEGGKVVPYVNVSVEVTDYRPLSLEEIRTQVREAQI
jgi:calcineurin-like phosphoesterase family protein